MFVGKRHSYDDAKQVAQSNLHNLRCIDPLECLLADQVRDEIEIGSTLEINPLLMKFYYFKLFRTQVTMKRRTALTFTVVIAKSLEDLESVIDTNSARRRRDYIKSDIVTPRNLPDRRL